MNKFPRIIRNLLVSMRIKHWIKNGFIFIPLIFVGLLFDQTSFLKVLNTFFIFCLAASSVYLLNDVLDKNKDINHPTKKNRPIARGDLSISIALVFSFILLGASVAWALILDKGLIAFIVIYYVINILYSLVLKNLFLLDAFFVAINYLMRVYAGAYIIKVEVSPWLFLIIFLFSLVVSFGKRKEELGLLDTEAKNHRVTLEFYTEDLLNQMIIITSTLTIICYILYTVAPETIIKHGQHLVYTTPFVVFGFLRYLYLVNQKKMGSPVEVFFKDKTIFITVALWVIVIIFLIYFIK
ncbi:MAG: decaprenyl-phosphate phosphoribosyltransferase [Minisyncoccia bacterium]